MTNLEIEDIDAELNDLIIENGKLRYRLEMLKRSFEEADLYVQHLETTEFKFEDDEHYLVDIEYTLRKLFENAVIRSYPILKEPIISIKPSNFADYQFNSSMTIAKTLKDQCFTKVSPAEVSIKIIENLSKCELIHPIEKPKQNAPPFININLNKEYIERKILHLIRNGIHVRPVDDSKRIIVDMSSPNVAKEMHVGHLRSTVIGDCLCNILEYLGYDVLRLNHIGDWGTQFGMLLSHLIDKYPDFQVNAPAIGDLQNFYRESKVRFDSDEEFKKRAYETVGKLQRKEDEVYKAWQFICSISRKEFSSIYNELNIKNLVERGESFYQDLMVDLMKELNEKGLLIEDEGRKILWPKNADHSKSIPLTLIKSDGAFTYDTSDLACIKHRIHVEKGDRLVYITDEGQATHFDLIFEIAKDIGILDPSKVRAEHVGFGVVLGEDKKKFKTRSGATVRLKDLLDEGLERSLVKLKEKGREKELSEEELKLAQKAVAYGCIKYNDLCRDRRHAYEFSFDRMLDDRGNTAVYLLYSLTRIRSIIRKANLDKTCEQIASEHQLKIEHVKEIKLAKHIVRLPEIIHDVVNNLLPHTLCSYLYDLSSVFTEFYENCYCISKDPNDETKFTVNIDRILLCEATAKVLDLGLRLLGIQPLDKM